MWYAYTWVEGVTKKAINPKIGKKKEKQKSNFKGKMQHSE